MIKISNKAQKYFIQLLSKQKKGTQIRVFVINPGTLNAECGVSYCSDKTLKNTDIELKFHFFSVFIDKNSKQYLIDSKIDLIKDNLGFQLTLKAPHARLKKISDSSPLFDKIQYFIQSNINPKLESHGGKITLIDIDTQDNDKYAVIKFGGGCNGCSMVDITLKQGIEKELLKKFIELKGVKDITHHQSGTHSYF